MSRTRKQPTPPKPVYVPPVLDQQEKRASRAFCRAAYRGTRARPARGDFDPRRQEQDSREAMDAAFAQLERERSLGDNGKTEQRQ